MKAHVKEWTPTQFDKVIAALDKFFNCKMLKNHRGETVFTSILDSVEEVFGLPYVSSSSFPLMALDCNQHVFFDNNRHFSYVFLNDCENVTLCLEDSNGNETFIVI